MRASRGRVDGDPVLVVEERAGGVVLDEHGIHGSTCVSASEPPAPAKGSALICSTKVFLLNASAVCAFARPATATARMAAAVRKVDTAGDRMRADIPRQAAQRSEQMRSG